MDERLGLFPLGGASAVSRSTFARKLAREGDPLRPESRQLDACSRMRAFIWSI